MKRTAGTERGMAVVAVMVLIAVLFLSGAVMALGVSSSLHTVDVAIAQDAIHYAAESAVARGVAAARQSPPCSLQGSINHQAFTATCEDPIHGVAPNPMRLQSVPGGLMAAGCRSFQLTAPDKWKLVWTVLGWRSLNPSAAVSVWFDDATNCNVPLVAPTGSPIYVVGRASGGEDVPVLHIAVTSGSVELGSFVARAAAKGTDTIVTVVGQAGVEVDEADVSLPDTLTLWNTVLP